MTANTEERALVRDTARQWIRQHAAAQPGHGRDVAVARQRWQAIAHLGWAGAAVPDAQGGAGMGLASMGVLLWEAGRELLDAPLLASGLMATRALAARPAQADLLAQVADGSRVVAVAIDEGPHHAPDAIAATAIHDGTGHTLHGAKRYVLHAGEADHLVVAACAGDGPGLFLVPRSACRVTPLDTIDGRGCAHVEFSGVAAVALDSGADAVERLAMWGRLGMATELAGASERMLERIVEHLQTREQFGRRIGSFQALQHRAAQMLVALEIARSAIDEAWSVADADPDDTRLPALVLVAKYAAGEAAHRASNEMVQMHGGIGMTTEHVAGRYLMWTRASEQHFGTGAWLADRYARWQGF